MTRPLRHFKAVLALLFFLPFGGEQGTLDAQSQPEDAVEVTRILFVFDASNSMNAYWGRQRKWDVARALLSASLDSLYNIEGLELGLRVYGHGTKHIPGKQDCDDTELVVPIGPGRNLIIQQELKKLKAQRVVSRGDAYSVLMAEPGAYQVGETFANWNIVVSTRDSAGYVSEVKRMSAAADENGFSDIRFTVYTYLTGENAGKLMAVIQAPNGNRLGAMLDELEEEWAATILGDMAKIRRYDHGFTMNCEVVYAAES